MSDPMDHALVSEIEFKTGVRLAPMIALEASIKNAILEARRALKAGPARITPNVQRPRDARPAPAPAAETARPAPPGTQRPSPSCPWRSSERAVFETLAGAPLHDAGRRLRRAGPRAGGGGGPDHPGRGRRRADPAPHGADPAGAQATAWSPRAAAARRWPRCKETMPDLVVLDGMLPEVHGFEICRQLKTSERFRHIPVILVSARAHRLALRGRREGEVRRGRLHREAVRDGRPPAPRGDAAEPRARRPLTRVRGRRPPAPQGGRDRAQAGQAGRRHRRLHRRAWPSTSSTTCSTTTWP